VAGPPPLANALLPPAPIKRPPAAPQPAPFSFFPGLSFLGFPHAEQLPPPRPPFRSPQHENDPTEDVFYERLARSPFFFFSSPLRDSPLFPTIFLSSSTLIEGAQLDRFPPAGGFLFPFPNRAPLPLFAEVGREPKDVLSRAIAVFLALLILNWRP